MVPSVGTHSLRSERYLIIDDFVYNDSPRRTAVLMGDAGRATCCCRDGGRGEGEGKRASRLEPSAATLAAPPTTLC